MAVGLGANIGDRRAALAAALAALARDVDIVRVSSVYETAPFGDVDQPAFLNACAVGTTSLSARALLDAMKSIESRLGRKARRRWGPREIDIDLLLYGDEIIAEQDLVVPHPGLTERAFVLVPLAEIAPDLVIPGREMTVVRALAALPRQPGDVRLVVSPLGGPDRAAP